MIRYEWFEQGKNPITLVRQSTVRQKTPEVLDPHEIQNLLSHLGSGAPLPPLESPYHLMVLLAATTGLRRSELFALKCGDVDFTDRIMNVSRSICGQVIGTCKTEASQKAVPLAPHVSPQHLDGMSNISPAELQAMWRVL